jgi:protein-tyrosine phosphatase
MLIPPKGPIDLHSHLLPGIDDGCQSLDESVLCVQLLIDRSFVGSVCTPHVCPNTFMDNTPESIAAHVARLREHLEHAGLSYHLWCGGELRIAEDTIDWVERVGIPTIGPSKWVLVDCWTRSWPRYADELCQYLIERGYRVLLAHPERMQLEKRDLGTVLRWLEQMGVRFQGNFNSIAGGEGIRAAEVARELLEQDRYEVMALDMHGPDSLGNRFRGMDLVEREFGRDKLAWLVESQPRAIVER